MSFRLWYCKRIARNIDNLKQKHHKFVRMAETIRGWIKRDQIRLKEYMKGLTDEENLQYGYDMGLIDYVEFETMKVKTNDEHKQR